MAHTAVGNCFAGAAFRVTAEAGGAVIVRPTTVFVADSVVTNLEAETNTKCQ